MDHPGAVVGAILRDARRAKRLTQARLAKRAGVTRETVYRVERGRLPQADTLVRMCEALGIDRDEFNLERTETDGYAAHPPLTLLRDRRRALKLTLEQCAHAAGVSPATLSRFERGAERSASLVRMDDSGWPIELMSERLATALGFETVEALNRYWRTGRL